MGSDPRGSRTNAMPLFGTHTSIAGGPHQALVHARCADFQVRILLETTAGQGSTLGHRFEHLAAILAAVADPGRLGVCFDTCHVFAAGYALAPAAQYQATMRHLDRVVGLRLVK